MAIYHCSVKTISRSQGRSSVASSAYRSGENLYNEYDGITHDYTHKTGIEHTEIILCENAPQEYANRQFLWNQVEKSENRKDSRTAREIEIALPIELNKLQQIELVREYVKENFTSKGMIADISIHNKKDGNPHAHIMLTTRNVSQNGFLDKNRNWDKKENLIEWRKSWEQVHNRHIEKAGYDKKKHEHAFIDHRSHENRGLDVLPTKHLGVTANALEKRGIATEMGDKNRTIQAHNEKIIDITKKIKELEQSKKEKSYTVQDIAVEKAEKIFKLKNNYVKLQNEQVAYRKIIKDISEYKQNLISNLEMLQRTKKTVNEYTERLKTLETRKENIKNPFRFKDKKRLDQDIKAVIESREQAFNNFKSHTNLEYSKIDIEIEKATQLLTNQKIKGDHIPKEIKTLNEYQDYLVKKSIDISDKKDEIAFNYKYEIVFAKLQGNNTYRETFEKTLENLEKNKLVKADNFSFQYKLDYAKTNSELNDIKERDENMIRLKLPDDLKQEFDKAYDQKNYEHELSR